MKKILITAAIVIIIFVIAGFFARPAPAPETASSDQRAQTTDGVLAQTDEQNSVTVTVTPSIVAGAAEWRFRVVMDTHSVELNDDVAHAATLTDDEGTPYQIIGWEGAPVGGHHREGDLVFRGGAVVPETLTLTLESIGGATRRFSWQL